MFSRKPKSKGNLVFMFETRLVPSICLKFCALVLLCADKVVLVDVGNPHPSPPGEEE